MPRCVWRSVRHRNCTSQLRSRKRNGRRSPAARPGFSSHLEGFFGGVGLGRRSVSVILGCRSVYASVTKRPDTELRWIVTVGFFAMTEGVPLMAMIVQLGSRIRRNEPRVWQCNCGCQAFRLYEEEDAQATNLLVSFTPRPEMV